MCNKFFIQVVYLNVKYLLVEGTFLKEQQKWIDKLYVHDFEITYKKGKENAITYALSRRDEPRVFMLSRLGNIQGLDISLMSALVVLALTSLGV